MDPLFNTSYDPVHSKTGGGSFASRPGLIPLSHERLRRFHPPIWEVKPWMFWLRREYNELQMFLIYAGEHLRYGLGEHLRYGLAEPAIVVRLDPLLIACYSEKLDAIVHLIYLNEIPGHPNSSRIYPQGLQDELIKRHDLKVGSRLLSLNTFQPIHEGGYDEDIIPGPIARGVYGNFAPFVAEFLTLDQQRVAERKRLLGEHKWHRCQELANEHRSHFQDEDFYPRDGRPIMVIYSHEQAWLPGHEPAHIQFNPSKKLRAHRNDAGYALLR